MILYQSNLITVGYDPAADIMEVVYPDVENIVLPEVRQSLTIMVEKVRHFDVKKLLIDASKTVITVSEEEHQEVARQLASELAKTRLQKLARIQPTDPQIEQRTQRNMESVKEEGLLPFRVETFRDKADAIAWLHSPG